MNFRSLSFLLLACLVVYFPAQANDGMDVIRIELKNHAKKKDLAGLVITLKENGRVFQPDSSGRVLLDSLTAGNYTLLIEGKGFRPVEEKIKPKDFKEGKPIKIDIYPQWQLTGSESLMFSQASFGRYWQQGSALNSYAVGARVKLGDIYKTFNSSWENNLSLAYGIIRQGTNEFNKNEDEIDFTSKFGLKFSENFLATTLLNARTQFNAGYRIDKDGSRGDLLSRFLAPAFINLGTGLDYQNKEFGLSVYYSPLNAKVTVVRDTSLSSRYLPKEFAGKTRREEIGSYVNLKFKKEVMKNVTLQTRADFFTNYLTNLTSIDINWETLMAFKVNKFLSANILTHFIYDEDIMFELKDKEGNPLTGPNGEPTGQKGPRTQFREVLNIGIVHTF